MSHPLVSFVVPCYNFNSYIKKCIDSIYAQKMDFDFEVLIRDDGSTDGSGEIIKNLNLPNLRIFDGSKNLGFFGNIKLLVESAQGKYISYIDGDDFFDNPDKTKIQVDFLEKNSDFVMHSTSYKQLFDDGSTYPKEKDFILLFEKDVITIEDMIEDNWGGYGRMFRNIDGIIKNYFKDLPYFDWPLNYELSKYGKIKQDNFFGGYYRISEKGNFTLLSEEEKDRRNEIVRKKINEDYDDYKSKSIVIIDCFMSNDYVKEKLIQCVDKFKKNNFEILLISNTIIPDEIVKNVDFYFYNHKNLLFQNKYDNITKIDFWEGDDNFIKHEFVEGFQRHGLSVLVNLCISVKLAKSLGYKYFQRVEVDDLFSEDAMNYINTVKKLCQNNNKKALFYYNEKDVSFHYFFSETDFFLEKIDCLHCEKDYKNYLKNNGHENSFLIAEEFIYDNLKKKGDELVLIKNGSDEMNIDFNGTTWNTETSDSNLPKFYNGVTTKIYRYFKNDIEQKDKKIIFTKSLKNEITNRKIHLVKYNGNEIVLEHLVNGKYSWTYNLIEYEFKKIVVFENDLLLYEIENKDLEDYINFY